MFCSVSGYRSFEKFFRFLSRDGCCFGVYDAKALPVTFFDLDARWWRSFFTSGSTGVWVFAYSTIYFSKLQATKFATYVLYFGYMGLLSLGLSFMTGCIGFYSCLWFTRKIYASIKVCGVKSLRWSALSHSCVVNTRGLCDVGGLWAILTSLSFQART